ncbi:SDR family NAD(P)-dependent oxidoreductase [Pseudonocardia lutea]|uniref:SDR family NAD(P)-dependent oxidoreductase n=1 Tax=Pseudonocardia lutea TaxID=2172015 RepID=A0ABW1I9Q7_9PSEU
MSRYPDKGVLVTGGASGLGRALARLLAAEGAHVTVADLDGAGAEQVAAGIRADGGRAVAAVVDVTDEPAVEAMVATTVRAAGRLDALFTVAAATAGELHRRDGDLVDLDPAIWDGVLAVNLRGVMLSCKHGVRAMLETGGGAIVTTSSTGAHQGKPTGAAYGASKAAIEALTRYVATMYGHRNIRCNAVAPGYMANPETRDRELPSVAEMAAVERLLPHPASPHDVAEVCAILGSDAAAAVTGQTYIADSGRLAHKASVSVERALARRRAR